MISSIFNIIIRFIVLVLIQVLVLNQVNLNGFVTPYIYPLFLLLLPLRTPKWLLLFLGFGLGLTVDMFSDTGGLHAFAAVCLAFARPYILNMLTPSDGYELEDKPTPKSLGFNWFIIYVLISIPLHHAIYFLIEILSIAHLQYYVIKTVISSGVSIILILLGQYLTYPLKAGKPANG